MVDATDQSYPPGDFPKGERFGVKAGMGSTYHVSSHGIVVLMITVIVLFVRTTPNASES